MTTIPAQQRLGDRLLARLRRWMFRTGVDPLSWLVRLAV